MQHSSLKFPSPLTEFFPTVTKRVNEYFKTRNISRFGNREMAWKTTFMLSLYLVPYFVLISGLYQQYWIYLALSAVMGLGVAGIGLSIMHDANHGAYSSKTWLNKLMGYSLNLVGGHSFTWKVQHNVLHHTYTNIHDADEDISPRGVLRMSPGSSWRPMHKYQHLYAWVFYGLLTFVWIILKDFVRLVRYRKDGHVKKQKASLTQEWTILLVTKVVYLVYIIAIPLWLTLFPFSRSFSAFLSCTTLPDSFWLSSSNRPTLLRERNIRFPMIKEILKTAGRSTRCTPPPTLDIASGCFRGTWED